MKGKDDAERDVFVPDRQVRDELGGLAHMTVWRWDHMPETRPAGWPPLVRIGGRKFRSRQQVEQFKDELVKRAIAEREVMSMIRRREKNQRAVRGAMKAIDQPRSTQD